MSTQDLQPPPTSTSTTQRSIRSDWIVIKTTLHIQWAVCPNIRLLRRETKPCANRKPRLNIDDPKQSSHRPSHVCLPFPRPPFLTQVTAVGVLSAMPVKHFNPSLRQPRCLASLDCARRNRSPSSNTTVATNRRPSSPEPFTSPDDICHQSLTFSTPRTVPVHHHSRQQSSSIHPSCVHQFPIRPFPPIAFVE